MSREIQHISGRILPLVMAGALCACTVLGPDYNEPEVEWLDDWHSDLYGQVTAPESEADADLRFWWKLFDDPALSALIDSARAENPSLRIAGLRILESRATAGIAGAGRYPQVQRVTGSASYAATREGGGSTDSFSAYDSGFGAGWELDFWGRFQRSIESADAAFFASISNHQDLQVLLCAQVADLYYAYLTTRERIGIAQQNAALQKRSYEITEELFNSGQQSELDLQQAKTQYFSTLAFVPSLESSLISIRNALAALLGRPPGEIDELQGMPEYLPEIEPILIMDIPARLVARRPDVREAAWRIAAQSAQIGIAMADYYPAISLAGTVGWSGNSIDARPDIGSIAAGPSFSWNVLDHGRISNNVRVQDARLEQAIVAFQDRVLQAAREIDSAAIDIVKTREQDAMLAESVGAARRSLDLANTLYREGYADFQRVLNAQQALFTQTERELVNRGSHVSAVVGLYKAIGGGWLETPVEELIPQKTSDAMKTRSDWGDLLDAPLPSSADESGVMRATDP